MHIRNTLHWFAMLLVLALALGLPAQGAHTGIMQGQTMAASMGDGSLPGGCPDGDESGKSAMNCAIGCAGLVSLAPDQAGIAPMVSVPLIFARVEIPGGRHSAPDPYPPRSSILS